MATATKVLPVQPTSKSTSQESMHTLLQKMKACAHIHLLDYILEMISSQSPLLFLCPVVKQPPECKREPENKERCTLWTVILVKLFPEQAEYWQQDLPWHLIVSGPAMCSVIILESVSVSRVLWWLKIWLLANHFLICRYLKWFFFL